MRLFITLLILICATANAEDVSGEISPFGDAVHVEFKGRTQWDYHLKKDGRKLTLSIPHLDEETETRFKSWAGALVDRVSIEPGDNDGTKVVFLLKNDSVDSFDYLTDQPSRLVIDFFKKKPDEVKAETVAAQAKAERKVASLPTKLPAKKKPKAGRKPAGELLIATNQGPVASQTQPDESKFGIFDGGDPNFSRFEIPDYEVKEDSIIASQRNMYLDFPMLELQPVALKEIWETPPIYEIKPEDNAENKKARLLLTLFNKKRYAVFLKTLDFFEADYPKSKYMEPVKFLEADIYYEMWKQSGMAADFNNAISRYRALVEEYPNSKLAERTSLLIGYSYLNKGDYLEALKALQRFTQQFKDSSNVAPVKLAMADSFREVKEYKDAIKIFDDLEADQKSGVYGVTAAFKRGDIYFSSGNYAKAIDEYKSAIKKYSKESPNYPNAFYNLAESLFHLKKYKEGLAAYRDFLDRFPRSPHGGYAMTRIGELLEILGADQKKVNGAWLESIFRYQGSVGAGVARVRLTSERLPEMKEKEVESALAEVEKFSETAGLPKVKEFTTILTADGLTRRKEFQKSLKLLVDFYQEHPGLDLSVFKNRIVENIAKDMENAVENGHFMDALQTYGKYSSLWLKNCDRIDISYSLGQSFEKSGLYDEASNHYRTVLNNLYAIKGTPKEKEKRILEKLPSPEQVLLRLATMAWAKNDTRRTLEYLENIKSTGSLTSDEKVQRVELASQVAIAKGQVEPAKHFLQELVSTWKGEPEKVASPLLTLARLDFEGKHYKESLTNVQKVLQMNEDTGLVPKDILANTLEVKSADHIALKQIKEAIQTKKMLLEKFEDSRPLESVRYDLGLLQFQQGDLNEAEKTWSAFKPDSVWGHLAQEQLANSKWKDNYRKYIKRIPAMVGNRAPAKSEAPAPTNPPAGQE